MRESPEAAAEVMQKVAAVIQARGRERSNELTPGDGFCQSLGRCSTIVPTAGAILLLRPLDCFATSWRTTELRGSCR
jgi:hypothetical protein